MPISFSCPSCQLRMTVAESMAGKRGKCSKCKGPVVVPALVAAAAVPSVPAPPPPPVPASPEDIEAAALDALGEPKQEQQKEPEVVEFDCPQCDEKVKLGLEHAGKRHPCPHCGRIIVVPVPQKQKQDNWRDTGPKKPVGARRDDGPAPEGAWGAGQATAASTEALKEAGVIKERERPLTFYQRYQVHMLVAFPALALLVAGWFAWGWWTQVTEAAAYGRAMALADNSAAAPGALSALSGGSAEYRLRGKKAGSASRARDDLAQALRHSQRLPAAARQGLLLELVPAHLDLGGDGEAARDDKRLKWDEAQRSMFQAVNAIDAREPRLLGVRALAAGLAARGQAARVPVLAAQLGAGNDPATQAEGIATAGLELLRAGHKELAGKLAAQAEKPYSDKKRPPMRAAVVALNVALGRPQIEKPKGSNADDDAYLFGAIEGHALLGRTDRAGRDRLTKAESFRAAVLAGDIETALDIGKDRFPGRSVDWVRLRLAGLALAAGADADKVGRMLDAMASPDLRAWGRLAILRRTLADLKSVAGEELLEPLPATTAAGLLARLELARHNCRLDPGWSARFRDWDEASRAFGWLGAAQAMQSAK